MKTLVAALILSVSVMAQASPSDDVESIFNEARSNFYYITESEGRNNHLLYLRVDRAFFGDCEDFAFTFSAAVFKFLKKPSVVYAVDFGEDAGRNRFHAVTVVDGYVYDFLFKHKIRKKDYRAKFLGTLSFKGKVISNDWSWQKGRPDFKIKSTETTYE